jgi:hypothetical protein
LAFLANFTSGLQVVDITRPDAPLLLATLADVRYTLAVAKTAGWDDSYVLAASITEYGLGRLHVCDVSKPTEPAVVASLDLPCIPVRLIVSGDRAFVTGYDWNGFVVVIDITVPTEPQLMGQFETPIRAEGIALVGDLAYVGDREAGLLVYDIKDLSSVELVGQHSAPSYVYNLEVAGAHLYAAGLSGGTIVFDVAEPDHPQVIGVMPGGTKDVRIHDGHALAVENGRFRILPLQCDELTGVTTTEAAPPLRQLRNAPNPFNPRTTITFELEELHVARLQVFDLRGRLVRTLVSGELAGGLHHVVWDGRDRWGRSASAGVFFYRLDAGGLTSTGRMTLVK